MKLNLLKWAAAAAMLVAGLTACDDTEEPSIAGTPPITAPTEVSAFFDATLPPRSYSYPGPDFGFGEIDWGESECFLINSMEEFEAIAPPSVDLPEIDFGKYTLLIGQCIMGDPGYTLEKQAVDIQPDGMRWNLAFSQLSGVNPCVETTFYFWGLYAKLPGNTLTANIIIL